MSALVQDPFYNRDYSPLKMYPDQDSVVGAQDKPGAAGGADIGSTINMIVQSGLAVAKNVLKGKIGTKGYSKDANIKRIAQNVAVGRGALAGLDKQTLAEIMTELSPSGSKYSADGWFLGPRSNKEIAEYAFKEANKWALKVGQQPITWEQFKGESPATSPTPSGPQPVAQEFDILIPFVPTMKKALQLKGITPATRLDTLSNQFYNNVVVPNMGSNFSGTKNLSQLDLFDVPVNHADEAVDAIITGIIAYINNLKAKKQSGEDLTGLEKTVVGGAEKAEVAIMEGAKGQAAKKLGSAILFEKGWIWIVAAVIGIIALVLVFRKK